MRKRFQRVLAVLMASVMLCSMAACGKGDVSDDQQQGMASSKDGLVWVAEFVKPDTESDLYNTVFRDGYIYYENYQWDEETMTSSISISSCSVTDGTAGPNIAIPGLGWDEETETSRNLSQFAFDPEGNLVVVERSYKWDEKSGQSFEWYYLCKFDAAGEQIYETDFSDIMKEDDRNSYVQYMALDGEGRIYLGCNSMVRLFDAEGKFAGNVDLGSGSWLVNLGAGSDGKVYLVLNGESSNSKTLREVDFAGKQLGASYENYVSGYSNNGLNMGTDGTFIESDGNSLYSYDMKTQTSEKILDWMDCDIYGDNVRGLSVLEDGRIMAMIYDWEADGAEIALLEQKPAAEVPVKTELVLGTLYMSSDVKRAAVNFNKQSDLYHVTMKSYFDYNDVTYSGDTTNYEEVMADAVTRLNNDIISDNSPDLLSLEGINVPRFASKGVFEDLGPWLDKSSVLKRSDYFENLLDAFNYSGIQVSIPKTFTLETLVGRTADVGTEPGWTLAEMLEYAEAHPGTELMYNTTKSETLRLLIMFNQGHYVDWETGQCAFDDESFAALLELCDLLAPEYSYDEDEPSYPARLAAGEILLSREDIYDFEEIQVPEAMHNEPVTFIGFPNENGDIGTYLETSGGIAILSKSSNKEGAWAFVESYLNEESEMYGWGFSTKKSAFEEAKAEATKVEYILDENGQPMLDENGEPMTYGGGGFGYDDWFYEYHTPTQEEVELLDQLIAGAKPVQDFDQQITNIVVEEAEAFFQGQKSAKDVAAVIQSRVRVYVDENR
ncbi:MAG: extracellular solute-binding protein [Clostridium sp.]|nr:extracellular solute-binding protein [Acetatifactor muris]MCM1525978.1 extracellular solute-binding protein [Bacteroides sp.]MCM1562262.1 extracellular solute-binding protein [Clostridium sp.]